MRSILRSLEVFSDHHPIATPLALLVAVIAIFVWLAFADWWRDRWQHR